MQQEAQRQESADLAAEAKGYERSTAKQRTQNAQVTAIIRQALLIMRPLVVSEVLHSLPCRCIRTRAG